MVNIFINFLILLLFLTSVLSIGLGTMIRFRILKLLPIFDNLIISLGVGFGILALIVFFLGILHLLYLYAIIGLVLPFVLLNISKKIHFIKSIDIKSYFVTLKSQNIFYAITILFIFLYILLNFFRALAPVTDHDSLEAYLYIPKLYIESHSISKLSFTMWDDLPLNIQMITTLSLLIKDGIFAQLITGWALGVLAMLTIYMIGKQLVNMKVGIIAAIIFYTIPEVLWLTCSTKVDLGWVFWEYLAFYLFLYWFKNKNKEESSDYKLIYLSFVFLGFSLGTKYLTLLSIVLYSLILLFILLKSQGVTFRKTLRVIFIANSIAILLALPYFIKNMLYTLNPLFPYIFSNNISYEYSGNDYEGIKGIINYYWNLFFRYDFIVNPMYYLGAQSFGPLIIGFLPSFLLDKKNRLTFSLFVILWFCITLIIMPIYPPQPRQLLNTIPLLIIPASAGMYFLFEHKNILRFCFFGVFILSLAIGFRQKRVNFTDSDSKVVFGKETKEAYLERMLFSQSKHFNLGMMDFIKNHLNENAKILTLYYCHAYYVDRIMTTDYNLENRFIYHERNGEKFLRKLNQLGITHVYLSDNDYDTREALWKKNFEETLILKDDFKNTYLELIFSSGDQHLFRINYIPK